MTRLDQHRLILVTAELRRRGAIDAWKAGAALATLVELGRQCGWPFETSLLVLRHFAREVAEALDAVGLELERGGLGLPVLRLTAADGRLVFFTGVTDGLDLDTMEPDRKAGYAAAMDRSAWAASVGLTALAVTSWARSKKTRGRV